MKKQILIAAAFMIATSISGPLFAQDASDAMLKTRTKSNNTNERTSVKNTVVCVGKIRCTDGSCIISFDQEIISPRDAASGLPTGKRMHKPFVITKELDKSSPMLGRESPTKQATGKVSMSDLSVTMMIQGRSRKLPVVNNEFTLPADCPNGACDIIASWSWGESNAGTSGGGTAGSGISKRYEASFNLDVEDGEFMASKYTKTGHVTLMK